MVTKLSEHILIGFEPPALLLIRFSKREKTRIMTCVTIDI